MTVKKKFLQANKQITKCVPFAYSRLHQPLTPPARLNSTMSQRIEELNAEISRLYNENLRLKASEIALAAELKRERDKSRKVMDEVEMAVRG